MFKHYRKEHNVILFWGNKSTPPSESEYERIL